MVDCKCGILLHNYVEISQLRDNRLNIPTTKRKLLQTGHYIYWTNKSSILIVVRGHPKMSTFSQVYKPYSRGEGITPDVRLYNKC